MHPLYLLNGPSENNSVDPNHSPQPILQFIAIDGSKHGNDARVVKLNRIAPESL